MSKPQQPELGRSGHSPVTEGQHAEEMVDAHGQPAEKGRVGRVPEENRPGHHPEREQDQPDPERFAERLTGDHPAIQDVDGEPETASGG
jgi:hypothetical protein